MLARSGQVCVRSGINAITRPPIATRWATCAGYATLREIETRLKSVKNIEKITKTMKIVASTKLTRAQRAMTESRAYGSTSNQVFENAQTQSVVEPENVKDLLIVCSSDKGLCGGIHSGMSRAARKILEQHPTMDVIVVGEKCKGQLARSSGSNIVMSFAGTGKDVPTFADAQAIADQVGALPTKYACISVMYNKFLNAQSYEPACVKVFSSNMIAQSRQYHGYSSELVRNANNPSYTTANLSSFEVDDEVLENLSEFSLSNTIYWALAEGYACEQSARRNAMDNASKNAGDMISKFTIQFNRTRQAVITGELVEIITGATASDDI